MGSGADAQEKLGSSSGQTFINMIRILIGMGTLTFPKGTASIGIIPAFLISGIIPWLSYYTWTWAVQLKEKCSGACDSYEESTETDPLVAAESARPTATATGGVSSASASDASSGDASLRACFGGFDAVVQDVLGTSGRLAFIALVLTVQFSGGVSYISAMEKGLQIMFPNVSQNMGLLWICTVLMGLTVLAPQLKDIALLSFASTLVLAYVLVSMPIEGFHSAHQTDHPTRSDEHMLWWNPSASILDWGYMYGGVGLSYCGFACGLCLYEDMKRKEDYGWVTRAAFTCSGIVGTLFGLMGYWAFGSHVKELAYFNFPAGSTTSYICVVSFNVILLGIYLVMMTPVFLFARSLFPSMPYIVTRCTLVILTTLLSKVLPSVMEVVLLLNLFSAQLSELVIPAICYLRKGDRYNTLHRGIACLCITTAVAGGCLGFISGLESSGLLR